MLFIVAFLNFLLKGVHLSKLAVCKPCARRSALLADNAVLERELSFGGLAMSYGFARGWFARKRDERRLEKSL
jgi:hypothetical protein